MGLRLKAHAKINLTLDVLSRRPDGYHQVEMIMQSIDLHDVVEMAPAIGEVHLTVSGVTVSAGEDNLILKAARRLQSFAPAAVGAHIHLHKEIPVAAGLAGGSTDAAVTLLGLNQLWNLGLSKPQLMEIASQLGADVPFCLLGGTALAQGIGEKLTALPQAPAYGVVLVKPSFGVSTAAVYQGLQLDKLGTKPATQAVIEALGANDFNGVAEGLNNVLESVTLKMHPELQRIKEQLQDAGCPGVLMSGSGPTIFGITTNPQQATHIVQELQIPGCRILASRFI